ncbi:MAG: DEAD/DEAH box helicase family protein [Candidatus Brocadiaceae bacterium]|nr:DEAD/DEAH box helicase family protein [Candidatus Brocadiaceae bacterium]
MKKLEISIKMFCKANAGKTVTDFDLFKNPEDLYKQFGIKNTLNKFKGDILEMLLEELFLGNGYKVQRLGEGGNDGGCDLLVKYSHDNSIRFVLQAKNWNKSIDLYDVKSAHLKFTDNYKGKYNLNNTHFCFVSWSFVKNIKVQLLNELNINVWDEQDIIHNLLRNYHSRHPQTPSILLEPYQVEAFKNILRFWNEDKRCYVEHSTGTGKTYIIAKLTQELLSKANNKILILSPSTYINDRIFKLLEGSIPSKNIARTYKRDKTVYLYTYQYLMHNAEKLSLRECISHIIMDEVHRAGAPEWHSRGLLNVIDKKTRIVGLSATMQRYSGGIEVKGFLDNNCAGKLSLFQAMARGILPVGKYVYSVLNLESKIGTLNEEIENKYSKAPKKKKHLLDKLNAKEIKDYSIQNIINKYYHSCEYRKIIVFCENIEHATDIGAFVKKTFMKFSKDRIYIVHSGETKKDNNVQFEKFSHAKPKGKEIHILIAVDMLNEGIDVMGIDSIMLFRRTESPRIYFQQIGRSIRKHGVETPLVFDCVLNFQNININFIEESKKEFNSHRNKLENFGFKDIDVPKTIHVHDELQSISKIINEVEKRLNLYPTYEEAKEAVKKLRISFPSEYIKRFIVDPRLPSNPSIYYKEKGWINWPDYLGREATDFYPTYEEAKEAVKKLGISSRGEYLERYKEDPRLTSTPSQYYKEKGWIDFYEFLGRETPDFYPTYEEAKEAVKKLEINQKDEYLKRYKEDPRLPSAPSATYKGKGWIGWPDYFGREAPDFYPTYEEAKEAVKKLGISLRVEYRRLYKEDTRLPCEPNEKYEDKGWIDWHDYLGKEALYKTYKEAKQAVKKLGITSNLEYRKNHEKDQRLPTNPDRVYKKRGWIDGYDFFGKQTPVEKYETYEEAKRAIKKLGISSQTEYGKRYKEDPMLPSSPSWIYNDKGWIDWHDYLGKEAPVEIYETYEEAKRAVKKLGISSQTEYGKRYKEDPRLPSTPGATYKGKGWIGWPDYFGREAPDFYPTYEEAKRAVKKLGISSHTGYGKRYKEDPRLPTHPDRIYKKRGWIDGYDFFGKQTPVEKYGTYEEAKRAIKKLGISSQTEYEKRYKEDPMLPCEPYEKYKDKGWIDGYDYLGKQTLAERYETYEEAKRAVKKLGISSQTEYGKRYKEDPMLPSHPERIYKERGWIGFYDFIGNEK